MEIFVLRTAANWERGSGAAVVIAQTIERVQDLMRDYEFEERLTIYETDSAADADVTGPTRHTWVEVERFPTEEKRERVVVVSWDEKI
jgi:crotonobetainyl-CoA:carnitine CoA-transferase CaiB-like acyl-CoA transferase